MLQLVPNGLAIHPQIELTRMSCLLWYARFQARFAKTLNNSRISSWHIDLLATANTYRNQYF